MSIIIPHRGRIVLCLWAAAIGALLCPFAFWQGFAAGCLFLLFWAGVLWGVWARACSFVAVTENNALTVYAGIAFCTRRIVPLGSIASAAQLQTPLLRLLRCGVVTVFTPGLTVLLPALDKAQAAALCARLCGGPPPDAAQPQTLGQDPETRL